VTDLTTGVTYTFPRTRKVIALERKFVRKLKKRYARLKRELHSV